MTNHTPKSEPGKVGHTPGPWVNVGHFGQWPNESFHVEMRSDTTTEHVATMDVLNNTRVARERADANAQLIAAAPELLKALKIIVGQWESLPETIQVPDLININEMWDAARSIIARAEGRPS